MFLHKKKFNLFFSDCCTRCNFPIEPQLTKLYFDFLTTQIIPSLQNKIIDYTEWWIFRPESSLAKFIKQNQLTLNLFFRPIELTSLIEHEANKENMFDRGNFDVLMLPEDLKLCLNTASVYVPDLYTLCLPHINVVNNYKSSLLKHDLIKNELYVDSPLDLIYSDPSSKFWIPRQFIHPYICNDEQLIFSWQELCSKFLQFITRPDSSITQMENSLFFIEDNSLFAKQFHFKTFHKNQIPHILKKITKFLGKSNTILTLCPNLKFSETVSPDDPVIYWIEELILKNNNLTPYISSNVYL